MGAARLMPRPLAVPPSNIDLQCTLYEVAVTKRLSHVILIHGLGRRATSMRQVAVILQLQGYAVTNWAYPSREQTLDVLANQLAGVYTSVMQTSTTIHFVTHS